MADRLGPHITIHLGWSTFEHEAARKIHGAAPFELALANGLLGPDVVATHCYVIGESDIDLLAKAGAHVAHCPLMNSVRGCIAPVNAFRRSGINVAAGESR